ncbi:MAG: HAMP domain-containing histidine kinase, partial [Ignavibacteria bacterium]|nr:HAMP domain-containing histidine kinase [Ignavibacteria bacterium]
LLLFHFLKMAKNIIFTFFLCLFGFIFLSCTKIENGFVIPSSTPYLLNPLGIKELSSPNQEINQVLTANFSDSFWVFQRLISVEPQTENYFAKSLIFYNYPSFYVEQVNFQKNENKNLKEVYFIPLFDDFNGNGSLDQIYFLCYDNFYSIQIRDQMKLKYPITKSPNNDDLFKEIWLSTRNENGFRVLFSGIWKISEKLVYLLFQKTNRLTSISSKEQDTVFAFNPYTGKIEKKVSLPPGYFFDKHSLCTDANYFSLKKVFKGSTLVYVTLNVKNGHNFNNLFNDFNRYFILLDSTLNIVNYDSILVHLENARILGCFSDGENFCIIKELLDSKSNSKFLIKKYSFENGKLTSIENFKFPNDFAPVFFMNHSNKIIFVGVNEIITLDKITKNYKKTFLQNALNPGINMNSILPFHFKYSKQFDFFTDINKDGFEDILCQNKQNQLIGFDVKNNKVLFASESYKKFLDYSVGYSNDGNLILLISEEKGESQVFIVEQNSFLNRLNSNLSYLTILGILLLPPLTIFLLFYLYLGIITLRKITYKNEILGILLLGCIKKSRKFFPIISNETYKKLIDNFEDDDIVKLGTNQTLTFPKKIYQILLEGRPIKDKIEDYNFYDQNNERIYLKFFLTSYSFLNFFYFYLVLVYETTELEKKEIHLMTINKIHSLKNDLGTIQNNLENLLYLDDFKKSTIRLKDYLKNVFYLIDKTSKSLSDLLIISNHYKPFKRKVEIDEFLEKWYLNVFEIISCQEVGFKLFKIGKRKFIQIDERQIESVLNIILENSLFALRGKNSDKVIEVRAFSIGNGEVAIEIFDNGSGIEEKKLENLFDYNISNKPFGTGFGLKIAKKICDLHYAKLEIVSKQEVGTSVKIIFKETNEHN